MPILTKIRRPDLRRTVYVALIAAFVSSIGVAVVLSRTQFNQDIFEGVVMLVAAFFVVTMIWFMGRAAKKLKGEIEDQGRDSRDRRTKFRIIPLRVLDGACARALKLF